MSPAWQSTRDLHDPTATIMCNNIEIRSSPRLACPVMPMPSKAGSHSRFVTCPICNSSIPEPLINDHIDCKHSVVSQRRTSLLHSASRSEGISSWWKKPVPPELPVVYERLRGDAHARKKQRLSDEGLSDAAPCTLKAQALPRELADELLQDLKAASDSWTRGSWFMFGKEHLAPRTSCYYDLSQSQKVNGSRQQGAVLDISEDVTSANPPPSLTKTAAIINKLVSEGAESRQSALMPDDRHGWISSYALANCYRNGNEGVGPHSDRLQTLGPRAIIASLSLGATRTFRITRAKNKANKRQDEALPGSGCCDDREAGASAQKAIAQLQPVSIDLQLVHNTLVIMWPPMQEEWKHEVPKSKEVQPDKRSGLQRFNLTFRKIKEEWISKAPLCRCNRQAVLKAAQGRASKAIMQQYYYQCDNTRGEACGFWQWADVAL